MAHHKSALKRVRQTIKRTAQKRSQRADLRTVIKKFRLILDGENMDQAREAYSGVQKNIDKAVTKGILHKRTGATGARYKSRLALSLSKTVAS
ncbi:MAG: 30S ribosomal protein S20 [SAR324 cluster bacterium]|uniref:Small ribosomal subunit protein bS20 n=1 Tax=SAR324 cluster bacterium TaxID=2024889 RepID=A0A432GDG5_9DELT|nr:MAG: 30S ribosomal protein S20 [SAR324 cluster bacterium]